MAVIAAFLKWWITITLSLTSVLINPPAATVRRKKMMNLPATMPGSMKEQIDALAPFVQKTTPKMNGGWIAELLIPIENFVTFDLNHEELAKHNLTASVSVDAPHLSSCRRIMIDPKYAEVTIDYNPKRTFPV